MANSACVRVIGLATQDVKDDRENRLQSPGAFFYFSCGKFDILYVFY